MFRSGSNKRSIQKEFQVPANTPVFTTKFVTEDKNTITYVSHDDGYWMFFSNDDFNDLESVARIVELQKIVELDSTILELADLPEGFYATRKDKNQEWVISEHE